jgi:hypothetical protein
MEGHLLAPFLEPDPPAFPFVALLVSGGHTQLINVWELADTTSSASLWTMRLERPSTNRQRCWALDIPGDLVLPHLRVRASPPATGFQDR